VRPEQIDESELKLDPNNARSHEKGIPELTRSLEAFGQVKPLVVWGDNVVIAGNGTLTAARQMGKTKLWIVRVPEDWDYNKARAFALADNATGDLSTWSLPQLDSTRWELDAEGWDVSGFGFEPLRPPPTPLLAAPDDVPPLPAIPTTKLGDLIILGRHRLVCGDATTNKAYDRVLEDEFVDAVWTDPPYNVGYVGGTDDHLTIAGDRQSDAAFRAFLTAAFHEMWNHAKPGAAIDSIVLDPFAGSGSTLVACEMMGARARLIEVDPKYCDVVITRWENLTGEKAEYAVPGEDNDGALH
jgi:16S rRNA G966 N2-methylase RsmD